MNFGSFKRCYLKTIHLKILCKRDLSFIYIPFSRKFSFFCILYIYIYIYAPYEVDATKGHFPFPRSVAKHRLMNLTFPTIYLYNEEE